MKYRQENFNEELKERITQMEQNLEILCRPLYKKYKPLLAKKQFDFDIGVVRMGTDPFTPGYNSSVAFAITDTEGNLVEFHPIPIWECERIFLGIPLNKNIPGSKIIGKMVVESLEEIKAELEENIEIFLEDIEK